MLTFRLGGGPTDMVLVDTSVWVEYLRGQASGLTRLLDADQVLIHPMVIGELACGNVGRNYEFLASLVDIAHSPEASHDEALDLIRLHSLMGRGVGFLDIHLLASARIAGATIWTYDRKLDAVAAALGMAHRP